MKYAVLFPNDLNRICKFNYLVIEYRRNPVKRFLI